MNGRKEFHPLQAQEIARAFNDKGVEYEKVHAPQLRAAADIVGDNPSRPR
jgi:DNA topoisomerase IA